MPEDLALRGAERNRVALQRVVCRLGRVEELVAPEDHAPVGLEPDIAHQRDERVEDLGDSAAERRRGQVQDAHALERRRELVDLGRELTPRKRVVVGEALVPDGDAMQHRTEDGSELVE